MTPQSKIHAARFRAEKLAALRAFFAERGVLEIEAPLLSRGASHDNHIGVFAVPDPRGQGAPGGTRYLQTSPEPHLKRLLARGYPDVYSIGKAFRPEESGGRHNPEFTVAEWYRRGFTLRKMIEETVSLCALVAGERESVFLSCFTAFSRATGMDPFKTRREDLLKHPVFAARGLAPESFPGRGDALNFLMSEVVEPEFDPAAFTVIHHFPAELSSQAEPDQEEPFAVQRFEVYAGGMELGNGYKELMDPAEYRVRFEAENRKRAASGKPVIPLHEEYFRDLAGGLPACAGVAVGFDRLLMLGLGATDITAVLEFPWEEA